MRKRTAQQADNWPHYKAEPWKWNRWKIQLLYAAIRKYDAVWELTPEVLTDFIEKIEVGQVSAENKKISFELRDNQISVFFGVSASSILCENGSLSWVRLRVKFIEHDPMDVEAMFGISFSGKYLIKAVCWCVYNSFCAVSIRTLFIKAGHIRTISAATSKTIEACCRSAAQP